MRVQGAVIGAKRMLEEGAAVAVRQLERGEALF